MCPLYSALHTTADVVAASAAATGAVAAATDDNMLPWLRGSE